MPPIKEQISNSIPPISCDTREPKSTIEAKNPVSLSIAIFLLSSSIAFSIRRTLYSMFQDKAPFRIPIDTTTGFGVSAAVTTGSLSYVVQKMDTTKKMDRRQFLGLSAGYSLAAGIGGMTGTHVAEVLEKRHHAKE